MREKTSSESSKKSRKIIKKINNGSEILAFIFAKCRSVSLCHIVRFCYVSKTANKTAKLEREKWEKSNKNHQTHTPSRKRYTLIESGSKEWVNSNTQLTLTRKRVSWRKKTHTHGNNEKIKRKREITSIYKYMFVKIFFTVNMFISIDYEVMINYVKEKISLHWANKLERFI